MINILLFKIDLFYAFSLILLMRMHKIGHKFCQNLCPILLGLEVQTQTVSKNSQSSRANPYTTSSHTTF